MLDTSKFYRIDIESRSDPLYYDPVTKNYGVLQTWGFYVGDGFNTIHDFVNHLRSDPLYRTATINVTFPNPFKG